MSTNTYHLLHLLQWQLLFILPLIFISFSIADLGTASIYTSPYLPTACYGNDVSQFPVNNQFAAASEGIWDNNASCGRQYLVKCLSTSQGNCIPGVTIQVGIVDRQLTSVSRPSVPGSTMALCESAFKMIADVSGPPTEINIEFRQV